MVQTTQASPRDGALQDLAAARRGLERPDKFPAAAVLHLAGLAMEGLLADWLDREGAEAGGYTLGHRIRALARLRPLEPAFVREVTLLGASSAPCGAWETAAPDRDAARKALALADRIAELTRRDA